jgi:sterol-4alpha-carboxylate 3-dehydrogenase (decarboxylating)
LAERLVLSDDHPFKTCTIRTHAVVGRYDRNLVPQFANLPRKINIGRGQNLYDFTGVDNLALAHVLAVENLLDIPPPLDLSGLPTSNWTKSANRKAFFVTNADPRPFRSVLELIWTELDRQERIQKEDSQVLQSGASQIGRTTTLQSNFTTIPVNVVYFFVWLASGISRALGAGPPWLSVEELGDAVSHRYFSNELAKDILGYHPVKTLEESVRDACESYIDSLNKKGKKD